VVFHCQNRVSPECDGQKDVAGMCRHARFLWMKGSMLCGVVRNKGPLWTSCGLFSQHMARQACEKESTTMTDRSSTVHKSNIILLDHF
jgi:hypothetical protein